MRPCSSASEDYHLTIPLKLAGENEVKAQVKLRFKNASRERMIVTRNVSVTVKKTGLSMKTLEGILSKDEANEGNTKVGIVSGCPPPRALLTHPCGRLQRNTISTKCSEIDSEVPRLLGVSQAILDNVIFCHQEESNWPLATPADLKKKFDEIFEATKRVIPVTSCPTHSLTPSTRQVHRRPRLDQENAQRPSGGSQGREGEAQSPPARADACQQRAIYSFFPHPDANF